MHDAVGPVAGSCVSARFTPGGWDPDEWILVRSPRFDHSGGWVQEGDHIRNTVPEGVSHEDLLHKRAAETYTSMVYARPFEGDRVVRATMGFAYRMAPIIVLAPEVGKDGEGRAEYREHFEVCLYDEGVNVWHHVYENGKPSWTKAAYAFFPLRADTAYEVEAAIRGRQLTVRVDGHAFGFTSDAVPGRFYAGVTGCEGVNRFYGFGVE